jgi:uncharacterized protein YigE (DUF2233 family)
MGVTKRGAALAAAMAACSAPALAAPCEKTTYAGGDYIVCRFDPAKDDIRLFLNGEDGEPYGHFNFVKDALEAKGEKLVFAMNAGMYHEDRRPVGLYVEAAEEAASLNTNDGPGNFHLKPNGVFVILAEDGWRGAAVMTSEAYRDDIPHDVVSYATQSGPMLVIGGEIHPRFLPDSDSLKRRNGVGVTETGEAVFVLSDSAVRFYDFATFFRDEMKTPNALYLDGTISRLYAPELDRNDPGAAMGPIVGVVAPAAQ